MARWISVPARNISAVAVTAIIGILRRIPVSATMFLTGGLARIAHRLNIRRKAVIRNLAIAFPEMSPEERDNLVRKIYLNLGEFLGMWLSFRKRGESELAGMVDTGNIHVLTDACRRGRGVLLCTAHFGNWELLGHTIARQIGEFFAVVLTLRNRRLDAIFEGLHMESSIRTIYRGRSTGQIRDVLKEGRAVALLMDQSARSRGAFVPFFGRPTSFHKGAARLCLDTGAVFMVVFIVPSDDGRWRIFMQPVEARDTGDREEEIERLTAEYARHLETVIRQHPAHWFWFHNRWKTAPPPETS